jgi:hypothetical protein
LDFDFFSTLLASDPLWLLPQTLNLLRCKLLILT